MLLRGPNLQLIPYNPEQWGYLAKWFFDDNCRDMWRHHPMAWGEAEFRNYPRLLNAQVFCVYKHDQTAPIGFIQMIPDCKTNRGFYVGFLIEKGQRDYSVTSECLMLLFDYAFNRMGYRKAIIEMLASRVTARKFLLEAGFLSEGTHFGEAFIDGKFVDEFRLSMSSDFFNKKFKEMVKAWDHS